ncbi:MAG: T9SS type A sorting domain-containing protein [Bacteroidia bacterium]|nr:T9SS type A sorting domain-containing protein [Bacteroidia bacterium]
MKKIIVVILLQFYVLNIYSQGFSPAPINFGLPAGGYIAAGGNDSYIDISRTNTSNSEIDGSQLWYLIDMNGDAKLDLVVYQEKQSGSFSVPGTTGNRYWKVFLNTGSSYNTTAINWTLPPGGYITSTTNDSYININLTITSNSEIDGSQLWYLNDLNGDAKPDLVVYQEKQSGIFSVPGVTGNRFWKVYLNTGVGFSPTPINFGLPGGGYITASGNFSYLDIYQTITSNSEINGSQLWYLIDFNGDAKPDLVVYQEKQSGSFSVPGTTGNRHWKIYLNNGNSFDSSSINWTLPSGGYITNTSNDSYVNFNQTIASNSEINGSQLWYLLDMNGDTKPELVVYQEKQGGIFSVPGTTGNRYWKVYLNNGSSFSLTATNWTLPQGGYITSTTNDSYINIYQTNTSNSEINGSQLWYLLDINGDSKSDLVVYQEKQLGFFSVPGATGNRHWKVFLNTGNGYNTTAINWTLPQGGYITSSANESYFNLNQTNTSNSEINGSQLWYLLDMNGDSKPDLVVYQEKQAGAFSVPGNAGNRYWKVYLNSIVSGVSDQESKSDRIFVAPNPFAEEVRILSLNKGEIILMDLKGKQILRQEITEGETILSTDKLAAGLYLLQYLNEKSNTNFKIVKH